MIKVALIAFGIGLLYFAWLTWYLVKDDIREDRGKYPWENQKK